MICFDCGFDLGMWLGSDPDFGNLVPGRHVRPGKGEGVCCRAVVCSRVRTRPSLMDASWAVSSVSRLVVTLIVSLSTTDVSW